MTEREEFESWLKAYYIKYGYYHSHGEMWLAYQAGAQYGRLSRQKQDAEICDRYGSHYFATKIEETS